MANTCCGSHFRHNYNRSQTGFSDQTKAPPGRLPLLLLLPPLGSPSTLRPSSSTGSSSATWLYSYLPFSSHTGEALDLERDLLIAGEVLPLDDLDVEFVGEVEIYEGEAIAPFRDVDREGYAATSAGCRWKTKPSIAFFTSMSAFFAVDRPLVMVMLCRLLVVSSSPGSGEK